MRRSVRGYTPIFLMMLCIPGFYHAFIQSIYFLFMSKATNLYLPLPWPWYASTWQGCLTGIFFIALFGFSFYSVCKLVLAKMNNKLMPSMLTACAFLALPYAHYAYSRMDVYHLALGIFPFLISLFAYLFINAKSKLLIVASIITFFILSVIVVSPLHPGMRAYHDQNWQSVEITGSTIKVDTDSANKIAMFNRLIDQYAPNGEPFLVAPFNFAMYSIFERESPMWDLYPLFLRSEEEQRADINRIQKSNPAFVVIYDEPLDGVEERRFHHTHPIIFNFLASNFELIDDASDRADVYVYKRRDRGPLT